MYALKKEVRNITNVNIIIGIKIYLIGYIEPCTTLIAIEVPMPICIKVLNILGGWKSLTPLKHKIAIIRNEPINAPAGILILFARYPPSNPNAMVVDDLIKTWFQS